MPRRPFENQNGVVARRFFDFDTHETPVERAVLFVKLAVFCDSRCAYALQRPPRERGLEDVGGVHCALRRASADYRVEFVDEKNDVARLFDFVHDRLDSLFELSAVFCARDHQSHVERDYALRGNQFGDFALCDFLRQALDYRGFADARLSHENRICLCAAAQNLNYAHDFVCASHDGVELAVAGKFGEVAPERFKSALFAVFGAFAALGLGNVGVGVVGGIAHKLWV